MHYDGRKAENNEEGDKYGDSYGRNPPKPPTAERADRWRQQKTQKDGKGNRNNYIASKVKKTNYHRRRKKGQRRGKSRSSFLGAAVVRRSRLIGHNVPRSDFTLGAMLSAPLSAPSPVIQQREVMTDRRLGS